MKASSLILLVLLTGFITACEDIVNLKVPDSDKYFVVDANLTNLPGTQVIHLLESQNYFDNSDPVGIKGAKVRVTDNEGLAFDFLENTSKPGYYEWKPSQGKTFGKVGNTYTLTINWNNEQLVAVSAMNRVPAIDSIRYKFAKANLRQSGEGKPKEGYEANFYARDFNGEGDCYRIKAYKNGKVFNSPNNLVIAYDANFQKGAQADGLMFILPIRTSISPELYLNGDSLRVDICSITEGQFDFFTQARLEINNAGLFARPTANIPTNLFNRNKNSTWQGAGWFGVSAVSSKTILIDASQAVKKLY